MIVSFLVNPVPLSVTVRVAHWLPSQYSKVGVIVADLEALAAPIETLALLPGNPRRGDVDAVARSLDTFGQRKPIVVHGTWRGFDVDAAIARAADAMFTTMDDHRQHRTAS